MMETPENHAEVIDRLLEDNYYGEDFEIQSRVRGYYDNLPESGRMGFRLWLTARIDADPSYLNLTLGGAVPLPEAVTVFARELDRITESSMLSRMLIRAIAASGSARGYTAVERFLESEQEHEVLACLVQLDFNRSAGLIRRALLRDDLLPYVLHMFHEHRKANCLENLVEDLVRLMGERQIEIAPRLQAVFASKQEDHNPFTRGEREFILERILSL